VTFRFPTVVVVAMLWCASAGGAQAQSDDDARYWYGWQTLSLDVASAAVAAVGAVADDGAIFWPGTSAFVLATPLAHAVHGRSHAAAISLALRLSMATAAGLAIVVSGGSSAGERGSGWDRELLIRAAPAMIVGGLLAMWVDARLLAFEEPEGRLQLSAIVTSDVLGVGLRGQLR
jgi:hypothetical protein